MFRILFVFAVILFYGVMAQDDADNGRLSIVYSPAVDRMQVFYTIAHIRSDRQGMYSVLSLDSEGKKWNAKEDQTNFGSPDGYQMVTNPVAFISAAVPLLDIFVGVQSVSDPTDLQVYALFQKDNTGVFYDWIKVSNISFPSQPTPLSEDAVQAVSTANGTYVFARIRSSDGLQGMVVWTRCEHRQCLDWAVLGGKSGVFDNTGLSETFTVHEQTNGYIFVMIASTNKMMYLRQTEQLSFEETWSSSSVFDMSSLDYTIKPTIVNTDNDLLRVFMIGSDSSVIAFTNTNSNIWKSDLFQRSMPAAYNNNAKYPLQNLGKNLYCVDSKLKNIMYKSNGLTTTDNVTLGVGWSSTAYNFNGACQPGGYYNDTTSTYTLVEMDSDQEIYFINI